MKKTILAVLGAAVLATTALTAATPAEAITKTTHCGVKTTWRFVDSDDNSGVKVKLWWKPSSRAGWTAFCGEAWDLKKSKYKVILQMQPNNYAWHTATAADKVSLRWDVPTKDLHSYYAEANLAFDYTTGAVWVVYYR